MSLSEMAPSLLSLLSLLALLALASSVAAHGHVTQIFHKGIAYSGYDPQSFPYMSPPPVVAGWAAEDMDNGFVTPDAYSTPDIICHKNARNARAHIQVAAGDSVTLQWTTWPDSHHGPIFDHLAACNGNCEDADKTALEFFRIDGVGIVEQGSSGTPGKWGSDIMVANGNSWTVQIPASVKPGNYVLRHDILALHSAGQDNGAQNYPQCFNLDVTGAGTDAPPGVRATELFQRHDPSIVFNIYQPGAYTIPGGELIPGAVASAPQAAPVAAATSSAIAPRAAAPTAPTAAAAPAARRASRKRSFRA